MDMRTYVKGGELEPLIYEHRRAGVAVDFTNPQWTAFTVGCAPYGTGVPISTGGFPKTTGITALTDGIQVDWSFTAGQELDSLTPGLYLLQLRVTHTSGRHLYLAPVLIELEASVIPA